MTSVEVLTPLRVGLAEQWYAWLDDDELRVQQCIDCGRNRHVPRHLCPTCRSDRFEWLRCTGEGEVFSWTTTTRALHPAFATVPFTIGVVALPERVRIVAPILSDTEPAIGMAVRLVVTHPADGVSLPAFHPIVSEPEQLKEDAA